MTSRAGFLLLLTACIAGVVGCGGSSNGPGVKQLKASDYFADSKVAALAEALRTNDLAKAGQLLDEGVDINAVGKKGITLATWTIIAKNKSSFKWLFDHGANPNLIPPHDRGVLLWTAGADDPYWLEILLLHKADVNLNPPTPLRHANIHKKQISYHLKAVSVK